LRAVSPTTGNTVSGVKVSAFSLVVANIGGGSPSDLAIGPWAYVPGPGA
jgi:hypothetical protein